MSLEQFGYEIIPGVVDALACSAMVEEVQAVFASEQDGQIEGKGRLVGGRNLQQRWSGWRAITRSPRLVDFISQHVGQTAGLVRILFF